MTDTILSLKNIKKSFDGENVLKNISLDIGRGEFITLLGSSGCGKTTTIRIIAGLESPDSGKVILNGKDITGLAPEKRDVNTVFQNYALFPHMNVEKNIGYGLRLKKKPADEIKKEVEKALSLVQLEGFEKRNPTQLSGGQKQRVAIARAIATNPKLLLCDEATSALDPKTTKQILELVKDINKNMGITVIVITHEMKVIESICDRVAIIENSKIAEMGKVEDIFSNPKSDIGKKLILGDAFQSKEIVSGVKLRIEFDGRSSFEPVLSNMILSCGIPVNILYAKTKDIGGAAVGHMIIQISGEEEALKVKRYMDSIGMIYHEVEFAEEKEEIE